MTAPLNSLETRLRSQLAQFKSDAVYKSFNYLASPQAARVPMEVATAIGVIIHLDEPNLSFGSAADASPS